MPLPERPRTIITGAASGLGRALSLELAKRRASILIADIDEEGARETARLIAREGGEAHTLRCDVSRREEVENLLPEADRLLGGVDVLINNAGVGVGGPMEQIPIRDWEWIMSINLWGVIYGCHSVIPRFKSQRSGAILNVASAAGLLSPPMMTPYNVTKAGVVALSETLHAELVSEGIAVTVLCPTFFRTNINKNGRAHGRVGPDVMDKFMDRAKVQADGVARVAIESLDKGRLYAQPHRDGRLAWRIKRAAPESFYDKLLPLMQRFLT